MSTDAPTTNDRETTRARYGVSASANGILGRTIDQRYRVDALLGEGGMGLVYRVTHTRLNKPLAIKVLRKENTRDEEVLARFRSEAESASAIGNEHIVDINDFGVLPDGSTYFVMECLEGMDLIQAMDITPRMPEGRAVHIAVQICKALGAAHDAGIVHRDLKPENVFLTRRDETYDFVKVLDFGIAKVANRPTRLTRQGEVLGTPHYMSPEQCEGENVDHRTDIYALGVLLYEMLTGHVPHDADTMMGILTKHLYEEPVRPRIRVPGVSEPIEQVIMRCLEKRPEQRYQTMRELEADLERARSGEKPRGPDTLKLTSTRPPATKRSKVSPIYLGSLAAALLALAGTLAIDALRRDANEAPTVIATPASTETLGSGDGAPDPVASESPVPRSADRDRVKRPRRKQADRREPPPHRDPAILDPWK